MNKMRVGVIGMGKMGVLHAAILNSLWGVSVDAVTDTEKLVASFLKGIEGLRVYNDYKKMIESSHLDAVYITTPVVSHVPIASYCAEKGLSLFLEKPIGRNSKECELLCKIVKKNKVISMVGFYLRYAETFSNAKALLDKGVIGEITNINSSVYQSQVLYKASGWRFKKEISGGGVLIDLGAHLIDILLWFFGKINTVQGTIQSHYSQEVEDTARSEIAFANGLKCSLEASWHVKNYRLQETTIEIDGTEGKLKVNEDYIKIIYNESDEEKQDRTFYKQSLYKGVVIDVGGAEYTREDSDFIECVRNNKQPMLNVIESSRTQSVIDSIYESAEKGSIQEVRYIE